MRRTKLSLTARATSPTGAACCGSRRSSSLARHPHRTKALLLIAVVAALCATAAYAAPTTTARALCGSERWALKTLSDPQRKLVNLRPRTTTVAAINNRRPPAVLTGRRDAFERQVWRVAVQIVDYKLETDSDIHLVLFGQDGYLIAEMPAAACLPKTTRDRRAIVGARRVFENRCGAASDSLQPLGAVAWISGVGFWDFPHGQTGHAPNYAELAPVTGIRLISGCA
jgi:hypothetical protein